MSADKYNPGKVNPGGVGNPPLPQRPPAGASRKSLFTQSGPVSLGTGRKETMMLGRVQSTPKPYATTIEPPPSVQPDQAPAPETAYPAQQAWQPQPAVEQPSPPEGVSAPPDESRRMVFTAYSDTPSPSTSWSPTRWRPKIDSSALVHPLGTIMGNVRVGPMVFISAGAVLRGDNEEPVSVGSDTSIQEGAVIKDLPTRVDGKLVEQRVVDVGEVKYSLYIGERVTVGAQAQVHGPAYIGDNVFIGMRSLIFWARVESGVVIEPGCLIMNVTIPSGVFVPAGLNLTNQKAVKDLPPLTAKYRFQGINEELISASREILRGYRG